jgi:hypothetical protein
VTEFWARADLSEAAFRGEELQMLGLAPDGRLAALGVIRRGEDLCEVECDACGDRHIEHVQVIIEPPGSTPRMYIGCKEAGRVRVEPERLEVQRIDFDGLARAITTVLRLGNSPRGIVDSRLWLLGSSRFGVRVRDVFLARGTIWPDGRALADDARLVTSPCPVILVPNLLPNDSVWTGNGRIMLSMSEFDWFGDDSHDVLRRITAILAEHDRRTTGVEEAVFRKDGEVWTLSFEGKTVHVSDALGLGYIGELLRTPQMAIEAAQLAGVSVESSKLVALPGIPLADEATIKAVRADLVEKKTELAGLQKSDWTRRGALQEEIPKLEKYLVEVETHQGKARKVAGTAQRSRTSVTNAINRAIDHISAQHPDLGLHLKESLKTGTTPIYAPVELPDWRF